MDIVRVVNRFLAPTRLRLRRLRATGVGYEDVFPKATCAPWITDGEFRKIYRGIQNQTQLDIYRCYQLWDLVEQSSRLSGALLEVGSWQGGSGALFAHQANRCDISDTAGSTRPG